MGIYIKGEEMPRSCYDCKLDLRTDICSAFIKWRKEHPYGIKNFDRLPDCPLVEVPEPHGRLIDENEVRTVMNWLLTQPQRPTWNDTYRAIQEMYATIEAEGEE